MKYQIKITGTITVGVKANGADKAIEVVNDILAGDTAEEVITSIEDQNKIIALQELTNWNIDVGIQEV